jgi:hypothetical protein
VHYIFIYLDGQVDVYEWDTFSNTTGPFESFLMFVNNSKQSEQEEQPNKKRKSDSDAADGDGHHQIKKSKDFPITDR